MEHYDDIDPQPEPRSRWSLRATGATLILGAILGTAAFTVVPVPYVFEAPGPVYDTLGSVEDAEGESHPLITIEGVTTYPTDGTLSLLTVSLYGSRENRPTWLDIIEAWMRPDYAVVPLDSVYPTGTTTEEQIQSSKYSMESSKREAVAAALDSQGIAYESYLRVEDTRENFPAEGIFEVGDIFVSVNGKPARNSSVISQLIAKVGVGNVADCVVLRDGVETAVSVEVVESDPESKIPVVGVIVSSHYEFPFDVTIELENVGGPSAGMMFALGIVDMITPGFLNGGEDVAGTGTITANGEVGAIGGIVQKMYGARNEGAEWFLAPADNCDEVVGNVPAGLTVFRVATLNDALTVLNAIEADSDLSVLPTCD